MTGQLQKWVSLIGFAQIFVFAVQVRAKELAKIAVCSSRNSDASEKKLAENIELELELADDFVLRKCPRVVEPEKYAKDVDIIVGVTRTLANGRRQYEVKATVGRELMLRQTHEKTNFDSVAVKFVKALQKKFAQQRISKPIATYPKSLKTDAPIQQVVELVFDAPSPALEEIVEEVSVVENSGPPKWFFSANVGGEAWHYGFTPNDEGILLAPIKTKVYPRVTGAVEWWPLSWLGAEIEGGAGISAFRMQVTSASLPQAQNIWSRQYIAAGTLRTRYRSNNGFGLTFRSAYRFWGAQTDRQMVGDVAYTSVPSFMAHALEVGGEAGYQALRRGIEVKLAILAMPYIHYVESPDSPGRSVMPFGLGAQFLFRHFIKDNWFVVCDLRGMGLYGVYQGEGDRLTPRDEKLKGGALLSYLVTASAGFGWSF